MEEGKLLQEDNEVGSALLREMALAEDFSRCRILCPLPGGDLHGPGDIPFPENARSALLVFLPYGQNGVPGVLAPFARSNYYGEAVARLKRIVSVLRRETGLSKGDFRIFCNSRFAEKQMAWLCGLGVLGRNSLLITPEYGSLGIIAGIFLPFEPDGDAPLESSPYEGCGSCRLCLSACPGGAVKGEGGIVRSRCYQYLSTEPVVLPPEITSRWNILYGCQICQDVCPKNRGRLAGVTTERGFLGEDPDLKYILQASDDDLKAYLKGSVLAQSWIDPVLIRRNALICLWQRAGQEEKGALADAFLRHPHDILAGTARCLRDLTGTSLPQL